MADFEIVFKLNDDEVNRAQAEEFLNAFTRKRNNPGRINDEVNIMMRWPDAGFWAEGCEIREVGADPIDPEVRDILTNNEYR